MATTYTTVSSWGILDRAAYQQAAVPGVTSLLYSQSQDTGLDPGLSAQFCLNKVVSFIIYPMWPQHICLLAVLPQRQSRRPSFGFYKTHLVLGTGDLSWINVQCLRERLRVQTAQLLWTHLHPCPGHFTALGWLESTSKSLWHQRLCQGWPIFSHLLPVLSSSLTLSSGEFYGPH